MANLKYLKLYLMLFLQSDHGATIVTIVSQFSNAVLCKLSLFVGVETGQHSLLAVNHFDKLACKLAYLRPCKC